MSLTSNQLYGLLGEELVLGYIQSMGYHARLLSDFCDTLDLMVEGVLGVHVKTSRLRYQKMRPGYYRQYWHFNVSNVPDNVDSLVVLVCEDSLKRYWFYPLPSWMVWRRSTINITSHPLVYTGRLKDLRDNWAILPKLIARRMKQVHQIELPETDEFFNGTIKKGELCQSLKLDL